MDFIDELKTLKEDAKKFKAKVAGLTVQFEDKEAYLENIAENVDTLIETIDASIEDVEEEEKGEEAD